MPILFSSPPAQYPQVNRLEGVFGTHGSVNALRGADFLYTDLWLSIGEPVDNPDAGSTSFSPATTVELSESQPPRRLPVLTRPHPRERARC
jgi:hypothetical protein